MACGCGKNRPRVNTPPRNPLVAAQANQMTAPPIVRSGGPQAAGQVALPPTGPGNQAAKAGPYSPSGLDAQTRRIAQLRRNAIRRALNK